MVFLKEKQIFTCQVLPSARNHVIFSIRYAISLSPFSNFFFSFFSSQSYRLFNLSTRNSVVAILQSSNYPLNTKWSAIGFERPATYVVAQITTRGRANKLSLHIVSNLLVALHSQTVYHHKDRYTWGSEFRYDINSTPEISNLNLCHFHLASFFWS